jgi:hypothetical protein
MRNYNDISKEGLYSVFCLLAEKWPLDKIILKQPPARLRRTIDVAQLYEKPFGFSRDFPSKNACFRPIDRRTTIIYIQYDP